MQRQRSAHTWSPAWSEADLAPRGSPKAAARAVELLGPFKPGNELEMRGDLFASRELAESHVQNLAREFNGVEWLAKGAPRLKHVIDELNEIQNDAAKLAERLTSLNHITRRYLHTAGGGFDDFAKFVKDWAYDNAFPESLPRPAGPTDDGNNCKWITALTALSQYAALVRTNVLATRGIRGLEKADRGGNTNLVKEKYGPPRQFLAREAWYVYDSFRPDEATATVGGGFHLFVCEVFEYATGKQADSDGNDLMRFIKKICVVNRRLKALRARERELMDAWVEPPPGIEPDPQTSAMECQLAKISWQIKELMNRL